MKFSLVTLYVAEMEPALTFYTEVMGLPLLQRRTVEHGELAFLGLEGGAQLELIANPGNKAPMGGFSIGFEVADMAAALEKLAQSGHPAVRGPFSPGPGTTLAFVKGPAGEEVELVHHA